jgi:hypothetical protein
MAAATSTRNQRCQAEHHSAHRCSSHRQAPETLRERERAPRKRTLSIDVADTTNIEDFANLPYKNVRCAGKCSAENAY